MNKNATETVFLRHDFGTLRGQTNRVLGEQVDALEVALEFARLEGRLSPDGVVIERLERAIQALKHHQKWMFAPQGWAMSETLS